MNYDQEYGDLPTMEPNETSNRTTYSLVEQMSLVYFFLIMVISIFGNLFVIILILKVRQLRTITNFFIVNVAVADLLVGALVMPFTIYALLTSKHHLDNPWCLIEWFLSAFFPSASSLALCCVSIDRYIAITRPFYYTRIVTKTRAVLGAALSWALATFCSCAQFTWTKDLNLFCKKLAWGTGQFVDKIFMSVALCIVSFFPIILFAFVYGRIFCIAMGHAKNIRRNSRAGSIASFDYKTARRRSSRDQRESKAAKATAIIIGAFVICWLPFTVVMLYNRWVGPSPYFLNAVTAMLAMGNSAINPILYVTFKRDIKTAFRDVFNCSSKALLREASTSTLNLKNTHRNSSICDNNMSSAYENESARF